MADINKTRKTGGGANNQMYFFCFHVVGGPITGGEGGGGEKGLTADGFISGSLPYLSGPSVLKIFVYVVSP